jgi:hypothetical protein
MVTLSWTCAARALFAAALLAVAVAPPAGAQPPDRHLPHAALERELKTLAASHRADASLVELGRSGGGRSLWALEIAAGGPQPPASRPGVLLVANLAPDQVAGSTLALDIARALLASTDPATRRQLATSTFYVVPRLDADGTEAVFASVPAPRRGTQTPVDDDNDGRVDEDPPEDLNGDGVITMMRVKDPLAPFAPSRDDARLMRRADAAKGEAGGWQVYWEGVDSDGDGFLNEDGVGGVDLDRNFPHLYPAYTLGAGRFMVSEDETRALLDYVLARRNIAAVLVLGATDTLIGGPQAGGGVTRPPATQDLAAFADEVVVAARATGLVRDVQPPPYVAGGIFDDAFAPPPPPPVARRPSSGVRPAVVIENTDLEVFRHAAERYRQLTGLKEAPPTARRAAGAFHEWAYFQFGVPAFSTPGVGAGPAGVGTAPAARSKAEPAPAPPGPPTPPAASPPPSNGGDGEDARLSAWLGPALDGAFVAWTPFTHPALGAVEIGGWRPFAAVPPPAAIAPLVEPHVRFLVELSTFVPRVAVASASATRLGGGLCRIRAEVENRGRWPTALNHAVTARAVKPLLVQLEVEASAIVSGAARNQFFPTLAGSGRRERVEWIVRARPGQTFVIRAAAQKGGSATESVRCE